MKVCLVPLQFCVVVGFAAAQAAPESVELDIFQSSDSPWALEHEPGTSRVIARLEDGSEVVLEIDYDGTEDDAHFVGITPVLGRRRLEGHFWGSTAPLIYPQLDPEHHAIERVEVHAEAGALRVRFEGGTRLEITTAGELVTRRVVPGDDQETCRVVDGSSTIAEVRDEESRHLEYFDRVTRVAIEDSRFGRMELDTWVERLQIQVNRQPGVPIELFELDFDHSF